MLESDLMNGAAAIADPAPDFDELRLRLREAYSNGIDSLLDRCTGTLILPDQQAVALLDAVQFTVFIVTVKTCESLGRSPVDRKELMQAYRRLHVAIDREVPTMLMHFVDAANEAAAIPTPEEN